MRKWIARYFGAVQVALALVGALLIFISSSDSANQTRSKELNAILLSLGTAALSSTFLSLIQSFAGVDLPSMIENRLDLNRSVYDRGLESVHLEIGNEWIFDKFSKARSIDLMFNTAKGVMTRYGTRIVNAVTQENCKVRILISDPENSIWKEDKITSALCPATNVLVQIDEAVNYLKQEVEQQQSLPTRGSIEIRYFPCVPTSSIIIVDGAFVRHTPYLPYRHSTGVPIFDIVKERDGKLCTIYQQVFDSVWLHARNVYDYPPHPQPPERTPQNGAST